MAKRYTPKMRVVAALIGTLFIATSMISQAAGAECAAVRAAVALQSKTPFHAIVSNSSTPSSTTAAAKNDMIWVNNTLYMQMGGRWLGSPMPPERALMGVTGGNLPFSECKQLPSATIAGQAATVYSAKMQSGEQVQLFISATSGQLLREILDEKIMNVTVDFDYSNVRAPALSK